MRVGDLELDRVGARGVVGEAGLGRRGVAKRAVTVQVPRVGDQVTGVGIARGAAIEVHGERRGPARLVGGGLRGWRAVARRARVDDAVDRAVVEARVVEVAARADLEIHREVRRRVERGDVVHVGKAIRSGLGHPHAVARVVEEEERAVVRRRVVAPVVEREARDRGAIGGRARVARGQRVAVVVRVVRGLRRIGGVRE